jgi:hypothetical protein
MLYTWLWHQNEQAGKPHLSGIYPLGNFKSDLLIAQWNGATVLPTNHLSSFEKILQELISDILNPEIPFIANTDSKSCAYCPFAETCKRSS